ncbi:MAG: acyltransferase [Bacteroidetes bacterium]|nr:acyltransferase [Bacteroidota bacterium]
MKLNLIDSFFIKIFRKSVGSINMYKNSSCSFHKEGKIIVKNGTFHFNRSWVKKDPFPSLLAVRKDATIIVNNTFSIFSGSKVYVNENATLILGSGYINSNLNLSCFEKIEIGENVAISENVCIRDSDNHEISTPLYKKTQAIKIGNHVWIGMNVTILKGVTIGDGAVIAAGAVVTRSISANCLAAGVPAKVIKENVLWK